MQDAQIRHQSLKINQLERLRARKTANFLPAQGLRQTQYWQIVLILREAEVEIGYPTVYNQTGIRLANLQ